MDEEKKRKITKNFRFIKNNIDVKQLIDHFIEEGIFSITKAQEFFSNTETMENRNNNFLILLLRSNPRAYDVFIQALEKNGCGFVAEKIKNTHVDKSECMMEEDARRPRPVPAVRKSIQARKEMEDAKNAISSLESEKKKMKNEMESVQRDRDNLISFLESEDKTLPNEIKSVQRERDIAICSLQSEMKSVQRDRDIAISSLRSEMEYVQRDRDNAISSLESENKKMKNEMESVQRDRDNAISSLRSEMESVQRDRDNAISSLESENKKMKNEMESVQRDRDNAISSLRSEMEYVQRDRDNAISSLESENKKMKNEMESVQRDRDNAISSLRSEMESVQRDRDNAISSLESENKKMKNEMESVQRDRDNAISSLQSEMQSVQRDKDNAISSLESEKKKMKNEMESVQRDKDKLSKIMGSKLMDNNPSISDLSDDNRALKLAEKYSELYDNQWTEAIEKLADEGTDEDTSVNVLLHIAKRSFKCCKQRADAQMSQLEKLLHSPGSRQTTQLTKENKKLLKDCRKAAAADATESFYEEVAYDLSNSRLGQYTKHLKVFVQKCAELFWMMCVQDPPLALGPEPGTGDKLDATYYKHYTRTGTTVQYIVWPPLLLYENGPILSKGVAQPFKLQKNNDLKPDRNSSKMMLPNVSSDGELIKATGQYYYDLLPRYKVEFPRSTYFQEDMATNKSTHSPQVHRKAWDDISHNTNSRGRIQNIYGTTSTYYNT